MAWLLPLLAIAGGKAFAETSVERKAKIPQVRTENGQARFDGARLDVDPGRPRLPVERMTLLLPPDADPVGVTVELVGAREEVVPGRYAVEPAAAPMASGKPSWPAGRRIVDGRDAEVYSRNALYPAGHVGRPVVGALHKFQLIEIPVYPYRYNPATGELRRAVGGRVVVRYAKTASARTSAAASDAVQARLARKVAGIASNFDAVISAYGTPAPKSSTLASPQISATATAGGGYAILTTDAIRQGSDSLLAFAQSKASRGHSVELITETVALRLDNGAWQCQQSDCRGGWGGGMGDIAANNLRAWLRANYVSHDIAYALLVGNPDPAADVPMKMAWPRSDDVVDREAPTDFFYADLTGDWDLDRDGQFGEYFGDFGALGADQFAELVVGRIPFYGNFSTLDRILAKTIRYQSSPDMAWRKSAILPMEPSDANTPGYHLGEAIRTNVLAPKGLNAHRVYEQDYGVQPETTPTSYESVLNAWNGGDFGLAVWWTHGWSEGAVDIMTSTNAAQLDDEHPSFTFQVSCTNASPENGDNLAYAILRNGGIGAVGATRVSWYYPGQTTFGDRVFTNSNMSYLYAKRLVADSMAAGDALNGVRDTGDISGNWWWMNLIDFTLYGDPSIGLYTYQPAAPAAPTGVQATGGFHKVTLNWSPSPRAAAYVVKRTTYMGRFLEVGRTTSPNFVDASGLVDGTMYYYLVSAANTAGESPSSDMVSAAPTAVPDKMTGVVAIAGDRRVDLSWNAAEGATLYRVRRSSQTSPIVTLGETASLRFVDTGLVNGLTYYYWLFPANESGEGPGADYVAARPNIALPAKVAGVAAAPGNGRISLSWSPAAGATSYRIRRSSPDRQIELVGEVAGTSFVDQALTNGTKYNYWVFGVNAAGEGPESDMVSAVPTAPSALKVQYRVQSASPTDNAINPVLQIVNGGTAAVALSELTVRYWYTVDTLASQSAAQSFWCDWANIGSANVTGKFVKLAAAKPGADYYLEVGFKAAAGSVAAGRNTGDIQTRWSKTSWQSFDEAGDYSYDGTKTGYADWNRVTLYRNGELVWGIEP